MQNTMISSQSLTQALPMSAISTPLSSPNSRFNKSSGESNKRSKASSSCLSSHRFSNPSALISTTTTASIMTFKAKDSLSFNNSLSSSIRMRWTTKCSLKTLQCSMLRLCRKWIILRTYRGTSRLVRTERPKPLILVNLSDGRRVRSHSVDK